MPLVRTPARVNCRQSPGNQPRECHKQESENNNRNTIIGKRLTIQGHSGNIYEVTTGFPSIITHRLDYYQ